jgi:hypothetical protein
MGRLDSPVQDSWGWTEFLRYFRQELGPHGKQEAGYAEWMEKSPDFTTAVRRACESRRPNGKMHPHQTKVRAVAREAFGLKIMSYRREIQRMQTFHEVWSLLDTIKPWGIGDLTCYDVAERLGRYLGLGPERVYLHAGPLVGARALGIDIRGRRWLEMKDLPIQMRELTADSAEDFLCVFRRKLERFRNHTVTAREHYP